MEQTVLFQITSLDVQRMQAQVSCALEKHTELVSRQKFPKLWAVTDRLNAVEKVSPAVRESRRKRRTFFGFLNWILGEFLLIPALVGPVPLAVPVAGAAGLGCGVFALWRCRRTLLGMLSLPAGAVLCMGALGNPEELGGLLALGVANVGIGAAALVTRRWKRKNPYDRAARQLLLGKDTLQGMERIRVSFSLEGMAICQMGDEKGGHRIPYSSFELVLETEDLILPVYGSSISILQKKDLLEGTADGLRELLDGRVPYVVCTAQS